MWNIRKLTDPAEILTFLERDRFYAAYAIGDLEPDMFQHTNWYVAEADGQVRALALLFTALNPDALFVMGDTAGLTVILSSALRPRRVYVTAMPEHLPALRAFYSLGQPERTVRMVLDLNVFHPASGKTLRLSPAYARQLERLYSMGQGNAFSAFQVAQGIFYGVTDQDRLVSTAGTHIVSETYGVAAVGNVFTHPHYRRQGLATLCTSAVVEELLARRIQTIVLNVHESNEAAHRLYERMGFKEHCHYVEVLAERRMRL
jgi:ribosomal protein S18 acetylase RimI-like enzyme